MSGVFVSYRRGDTRHVAGRLYDWLVEVFRHESVFMDVDSIEPGVDFAEAIERALGSCQAQLVLIGPQWLVASDADGRRRLHDPDDYVALEVAAEALRKVLDAPPTRAEPDAALRTRSASDAPVASAPGVRIGIFDHPSKWGLVVGKKAVNRVALSPDDRLALSGQQRSEPPPARCGRLDVSAELGRHTAGTSTGQVVQLWSVVALGGPLVGIPARRRHRPLRPLSAPLPYRGMGGRRRRRPLSAPLL